ncbi:MAG: hypothetical protein FH760_12630 [Geosporobacter ferrireducens]|nr:hypothetical protein [Geosporobacter ferrireducens]
MKKIEPISASGFAHVQNDLSSNELDKENALLRRELPYYVPLENEMRIMEEECPDRLFDMISKQKDIPKDVQKEKVYNSPFVEII